MNFGPKNNQEAVIFAVEELRASVQYDILRHLKTAGISQAQLAARMGVSAAWISQLLSDDANLTLESVAKVYAALGQKCSVVAEAAVEERRAQPEFRAPIATLWKVEAEKVVKAEFSERRQGTTQLLMTVIASRSSRVRSSHTCNDNWAEREITISEAV